MATTTTTIRATTTTFVSCAAESGRADAFSFAALYRAYQACRRRKRGTRNAQRYEIRLLDNLADTLQALRNGAWRPSRSVCFVTRTPKAREIHAADFADRVVHHLLTPRLEALFEPVFIHDSYANRVGKGTHAAVDCLQTFMRRVSCNGKRAAWYMQLDIRNFFNSIDRRLLYRMLLKRLARSVRSGRLERTEAGRLAWLVRTILAHEAGKDTVRRGPASGFDLVPPHKRLAHAAPGTGIPIGNLTSQFFANVYLNELDQFVKHRLKAAHYLRYVDDFILVHQERAVLERWRSEITAFLRERLSLALRGEVKLCPVSSGADFLGYIVRPGYRLVRHRVIGSLRQRLTSLERQMVRNDKGGSSLLLKPERRDMLRSTLASYLGHFKHADTFRLRSALWRRYPWLGDVFELLPDGGLLPLWEPQSVTSLRSQWRYFRRLRPTDLLLLQIGDCFELYDGDARSMAARLGISLAEHNRPGFSAVMSQPLRLLRAFRARLRRLGLAHAFVAEEGHLKKAGKRRVLRLCWRPRVP
jgi:RNA-directed DNA polymerase